jgi:hypothetical protein
MASDMDTTEVEPTRHCHPNHWGVPLIGLLQVELRLEINEYVVIIPIDVVDLETGNVRQALKNKRRSISLRTYVTRFEQNRQVWSACKIRPTSLFSIPSFTPSALQSPTVSTEFI